MSIFRFNYQKPEDMAPVVTVLTPGEAKFKVIGAFDKKKDGTPLTTMKGDPKLRLSLSVTDSTGDTSIVYEDITPNMPWKIKAILDSVGLGALYDESGAFSPDDIVNAMGKCIIETRKAEGYEDSTIVKRFVKAPVQAVVSRDLAPPMEPSDDSLPF